MTQYGDQAADRIAALVQERDEAWNAAIEAAARESEADLVETPRDNYDLGYNTGCRYAAEAVRRLKR